MYEFTFIFIITMVICFILIYCCYKRKKNGIQLFSSRHPLRSYSHTGLEYLRHKNEKKSIHSSSTNTVSLPIYTVESLPNVPTYTVESLPSVPTHTLQPLSSPSTSLLPNDVPATI